MAPFVRVQCPKCDTIFDVTKMVYDEGPKVMVFCPLCTARWPREEGKVLGANFRIGDAAKD